MTHINHQGTIISSHDNKDAQPNCHEMMEAVGPDQIVWADHLHYRVPYLRISQF
jgi:hypothetical protein